MKTYIEGLYWHCASCGAHERVESTGDPTNEYAKGDEDPCVMCGGRAVAMSVEDAARVEQRIALGRRA